MQNKMHFLFSLQYVYLITVRVATITEVYPTSYRCLSSLCNSAVKRHSYWVTNCQNSMWLDEMHCPFISLSVFK